MPDPLFRKLKRAAVERKTTMRELIVEAVDSVLKEPKSSDFRLRDASVGSGEASSLDADAVNRAIDALREPDFRL